MLKHRRSRPIYSSSSSDGPTGFASQLGAPRHYRLEEPFQTRDNMAVETLKCHPPFLYLTGPNEFKLDGCPFGYEDIEDYRPGGHHPVHLDDELDGRYRLIVACSWNLRVSFHAYAVYCGLQKLRVNPGYWLHRINRSPDTNWDDVLIWSVQIPFLC